MDYYAIYRGEQDFPGGSIDWPSTPTATTTSTTWTDSWILINTSGSATVYYKIKAVDEFDQESDYSNTVSSNTLIIPKTGGNDSLSVKLDFRDATPDEFALLANYPNPFNPETQIRLELPQAGEVVLTVFNITGVEIRTLHNGSLAAGYHTFSWDGKDTRGLQVPSGVYFYRFEAKIAQVGRAAFAKIGKMTLLR